MPLSKNSLQTRIVTELSGQGFSVGPHARDNINWLNRLATAIANAVVDEIVENSELIPTSKDSGTAGSGIITGKVI